MLRIIRNTPRMHPTGSRCAAYRLPTRQSRARSAAREARPPEFFRDIDIDAVLLDSPCRLLALAAMWLPTGHGARFARRTGLSGAAPAAVPSLQQQQCNTSASPYIGEIGVNVTIQTRFFIINGDVCVNIFSSAWL
jgi:hypothetical protein